MGIGNAVGLIGLAELLGLTVLLGCGGSAERSKAGVHQTDGADVSDSGELGGTGGGTGGGVEPDPPACRVDTVRCNPEGLRESCTADGSWVTSDFVCATALAVDDEVGSYCATKADGSYRCWGGEPFEMLPPARYQRVQLASAGLIGLTREGELVGAVPPVVQELPRTAAFNATNMWGKPTVCPLAEDGSFRIVSDVPDELVEDPPEPHLVEGHFAQAFCVFEGLAVGVLSNGSLWTIREPTPAGSDWTELAMSLGIFCGITQGGAVVCHEPFLACNQVSVLECIVAEPPVFPPGRYHSIAATSSVACAVDEQGMLVCRRFDGVELPVAAGPYSFIQAGREVLCAVRTDGSVACFRHGGTYWPDEVDAFERIEPIDDVDW